MVSIDLTRLVVALIPIGMLVLAGFAIAIGTLVGGRVPSGAAHSVVSRSEERKQTVTAKAA